VLTRYLTHDLGPRHITVNTVAPGAVQTDFSGGVVRDNPAVNKYVSDITALGRPGLPEDIGQMVASLLSDANHWVNGQRIEVSGGCASDPTENRSIYQFALRVAARSWPPSNHLRS
jgi:NAD(P)-dependent dehydrogenase (short-subunit alcohol dehydrogenase family)